MSDPMTYETTGMCSGGAGGEVVAPYCARCAEKDKRIEVLSTMSYPDAQRQLREVAAELEKAHGVVMRQGGRIAALEADLVRLRALVAVGREMANIGDGMGAMFATHWLVKDTDEEVHETVRLWWEARAKWRTLDTEGPR